ncbi:MAG: hypothetical protein E7526_06230 [Ruminococcaceae bacterium]|nr:hypothetical protein [Oscillospiraceae bacterium]
MRLGRIVCSISGHDKGLYMVVVGETPDGVKVCNGKQRRLQNPKLKNVKHLYETEYFVSEEQLKTNKSLRKAIYECFGKYKEETLCQKKI